MASFKFFYLFKRVNWEGFEKQTINYLKIRYCITINCHFIKIMKGPETSFQSQF